MPAKTASATAFTSHTPCQLIPASIIGEKSIITAMPSGMKVDQMAMAFGTSAGLAAPRIIFGADTVTAI
jgi:hypothetical protein